MPLIPGARRGPYEIQSAIGSGGMGEVYRARDTRLKRDVALKILPASFATDPDRLARFQREAEVLASLNHPNIAAIYGLEESDGVRALVMELVEGEDLSERIARGPIPLDEVLPIAKQIAEALEAAHEQGIIHRDLKPANIKVRQDGNVKVLDFGLAKLADPSHAPASDLSLSPTITSPAMMTGIGVILGTAAYMAPEQAKGKPADRRSDIWAFGCVLYEMLTGHRVFRGEETAGVLGAILHLEPDWDALPSGLPETVRVLVQGCLAKDRRARMASITTALFLIDRTTSLTPQKSIPRMNRIAALSAGAIVVAAVAGTAVWSVMRQGPPPPRISRLSLGATGSFTPTIGGNEPALTMTPDGSRIVYVGNRGTQLFVRRLDALEPAAVFTGAPDGPFVSTDGRWIGFADGLTLKKVAVTGGPPVTLATLDGAFRGGTWGSDDRIIFATFSRTTGLQSIAGSGGPTKALTQPDPTIGEGDHEWPELLPNGRGVLFTILAPNPDALDAAQVAVLDLQTGARKVLVRGASHARYVNSGHLVYQAGGALRAIPFDVATRETRGTAVPVVPSVMTTSFGGVNAFVATDGTLAYVAGGSTGAPAAHTLVWVDRQGHETPIAAPPRLYANPRLSPDGTRVVLLSYDQEADLWQWDFARQTLTRLTLDPSADGAPFWTPDGRRLVFSSNRASMPNFDLYSISVGGTGSIVRLTDSPTTKLATGMTPDGTGVIFSEGLVGKRDLRLLRLPPASGAAPVSSPPTGKPGTSVAADIQPLIATRFDEGNGTVSPDGHWLAFESDSSGRLEVYVRPFPDVNGGQWLVSTAGGRRPVWARSGRELFYNADDGALMTVPVEARGATWSAGAPKKLIEGHYFASSLLLLPHYDVTADNQRFLMIKETTTESAGSPLPIIIVQNWLEELKRLVPTN